jgi:hypothetical protein
MTQATQDRMMDDPKRVTQMQPFWTAFWNAKKANDTAAMDAWQRVAKANKNQQPAAPADIAAVAKWA